MQIRQLGRAAVVAAALAGLNACASIPKRAWDNGAGLTRSDAYRAMMHGDRSIHTMRSLYTSMDPYRSLYTARPYTPFGRW